MCTHAHTLLLTKYLRLIQAKVPYLEMTLQQQKTEMNLGAGSQGTVVSTQLCPCSSPSLLYSSALE